MDQCYLSITRDILVMLKFRSFVRSNFTEELSVKIFIYSLCKLITKDRGLPSFCTCMTQQTFGIWCTGACWPTGTPGKSPVSPTKHTGIGHSLQAKIILQYIRFYKKPVYKYPSTRQPNDLGSISESPRAFYGVRTPLLV